MSDELSAQEHAARCAWIRYMGERLEGGPEEQELLVELIKAQVRIATEDRPEHYQWRTGVLDSLLAELAVHCPGATPDCCGPPLAQLQPKEPP